MNRTVFLDKDRMMDNVQKHNVCTKLLHPMTKWTQFPEHIFMVLLISSLTCPSIWHIYVGITTHSSHIKPPEFIKDT
jgi:hypothetical protein